MSWEQGEIVHPPGGKPYQIAETLGQAGTVHITAPYEDSPGGRFWAIWSYPSTSGLSRPVFHGRPTGFEDVDVVMRQHQHAIRTMMGTAIRIPSENGQEDQFIQVPGELDRVREYNGLLQRAARTLVRAEGPAAINSARDDLEQVLRGFSRSRTHKRKLAREALLQGSNGDPSEMLGASLGVQSLNIKTEEDLVEMTIATMARFNALGQRDTSWRKNLDGLEGKMGQAIRDLRGATDQPEKLTGILHGMRQERTGLRWILADFTGEPYYSHAQKILESLSTVRNGEPESYPIRLANRLAEQAAYVQVWRNSRSGSSTQYSIDLDLATVGGAKLTL